MPKSDAPLSTPAADLDVARIAEIAAQVHAQAQHMTIPGRLSDAGADVVQEAIASGDTTNFETAGWRKFKSLTDGAPVYADIVSKDKKHHFCPRFGPVGRELLLPLNQQTARYVEFGNLQALDDVGAAYAASASTHVKGPM